MALSSNLKRMSAMAIVERVSELRSRRSRERNHVKLRTDVLPEAPKDGADTTNPDTKIECASRILGEHTHFCLLFRTFALCDDEILRGQVPLVQITDLIRVFVTWKLFHERVPPSSLSHFTNRAFYQSPTRVCQEATQIPSAELLVRVLPNSGSNNLSDTSRASDTGVSRFVFRRWEWSLCQVSLQPDAIRDSSFFVHGVGWVSHTYAFPLRLWGRPLFHFGFRVDTWRSLSPGLMAAHKVRHCTPPRLSVSFRRLSWR